jgi:hypothetical protein
MAVTIDFLWGELNKLTAGWCIGDGVYLWSNVEQFIGALRAGQGSKNVAQYIEILRARNGGDDNLWLCDFLKNTRDALTVLKQKKEVSSLAKNLFMIDSEENLRLVHIAEVSLIISLFDQYNKDTQIDLLTKRNLERLFARFAAINSLEYVEDFAGAIQQLTQDKLLNQQIFDDLIAAAAPSDDYQPGERVWHTAMGLRRLGLEGPAMLRKHRAEIIAAGTGAERLAIEIVGKKRFGIPTSDDLKLKIRELEEQCRVARVWAVDTIAQTADIRIQKKSKMMNKINRFFHAIARFFYKITKFSRRKSKLSLEATEILATIGVTKDFSNLPQYKVNAISEIVCALHSSQRDALLTAGNMSRLYDLFAAVENSKQAKDFATAIKWLSYNGRLNKEIFDVLIATQRSSDGVEAAWYIAAGLRHLQLVGSATFDQHYETVMRAGFRAERLAVEITDKARTDVSPQIPTSSELRHHISLLEHKLKTAASRSLKVKVVIMGVKFKQWFARICPAIFKTTTADRRDDADSTLPSPVVGGGRLPLPPSPPGGMGWGGSSPVHGAYFGDGFDYGVAPPPSRGGASRAAPAR